jgi:cell division protease FtsH
MLPHADPVHKISIVSRGMMGGYTRLLPTEDRYFWTRSQFEDVLCVDLGGYVAEEVVFQDVTTGSSNDIEQTTELARKMITRYGMGELGPRSFGKREELVFLGKEITEEKNYSEKTAEEIDSEVHRLITTALSKTRQIILENRERLDNIVSELISKETLEGEDLERVLTPAPVNPFEDELHNQQAPGETLG